VSTVRPRRAREPQARLAALLRAAADARKRAYAPYSRFPVGAAVLTSGRIFAAGNLENSSYPLSVCAERNAVAMAVAAGQRHIEAAAIVAGDARPAPPCGGCRQVLAEFAGPDAPVIYASTNGRSVTTSVGALLPESFGRGDLSRASASGKGKRRSRGGIPV